MPKLSKLNSFKKIKMSTISHGFLRSSRALFTAAKSTVSSSSSSKPKIPSKKPTKTCVDSKEKKRTSSFILKGAPVSPTLRGFVGVPEISRSEAIKKIWDYIKLHNLQNPLNKREIFCDTKLKKLFDGKEKVGFLEIAKLLSPHFIKTS